jgi:hypothetical protein
MPEKGNYSTLKSIIVPLTDFQGRAYILISAFRIATENHPYPCRFCDVVKEKRLEHASGYSVARHGMRKPKISNAETLQS